MRIRPLLTAVLIPFFALAGFAQQATTQPAPSTQPIVRGPVLTEADGSPVKGVHLARADLRAVLRGSLAEATMTLTFANTEDRVLGGELVFPLPEGATVTGYGLDIGGVMVNGVAVGKQQARVIYEKEMPKRVDPGLVEHVAGNAFRTRLYPVPARGTRSIKVQYVTDAVSTTDGLSVSLPLGWGRDVDRCTVRLEAPDATSQPAVRGDVLAFRTAEHGFVAEGELKDTPEELVIGLPGLPERSVAIEKRVRPVVSVEDLDEQGKGGEAAKAFERFEHYFLINDTPVAPARDIPRPAMKHVAVLWDAGLSRAQADKSRELKLLDALLKQWPEASADLVVFRDKVETPAWLDPMKSNREQIIEQLNQLVYDGASNLGDLPLPANRAEFPGVIVTRPEPNYDCILLFTSGIASIGPETMQKAEVPVYVFSDDPRANHALLRHVCRESGGQYFNLKRLTDEQVLSGVGHEPYVLVSIDSKAGEVGDIYPASGIPATGRIALAGKLLVPEATITLNYGFGRRVFHSSTFTLKANDATQGDLVPRYWAQQKVAELSMQPGINDEELAKVGKQFNLVTPNTSLLVLETADQYVRYQVVPPRDRPEIYKQFLAQIEQAKSQERQTKEEKIQQVLAMWDGRVKWWEQSFDAAKGTAIADGDSRQRDLSAAAVSLPAPIDLPPLAPDAIPAQRREAAAADLRATAQLLEIQKAANAYKARILITQAAQARAASDFTKARDLYAQAAGLDPASQAATDGRRDMQNVVGADSHPRAGNNIEVERDQIASPARPLTDRERKVADLISQARDLTYNARYEEAKKVIDQILVFDPRNDYGIGVRPLLDDRVRQFEQRQFSERFDVEAQKSLNAAGGRAIPYDDILRYPSDWPALSSSNGPGLSRGTTRPERGRDAGINLSYHGALSDTGSPEMASSSINVKPWDPAMPYLVAMKAVPADKAYGVYLEQRKAFGTSPAFYLDCGDYLQRIGQHELAVRVLTNVAALKLADARLLRVAAHCLQQIGEAELAIDLFEAVLKMRPEEPQSHRDLALALADRADAIADLAKGAPGRNTGRIASDYARSLDLLNQVLAGRWDRFPEIELPCLMEANRIIARVNRLKQAGEIADVPVPLDPRLVKDLECDLRVVMTWDTDHTDIDLWVTEPTGEKCFYGHNRTAIGGLLSRDFTDGYGPEEYCLRRCMPGKYAIQANYYSTRQQELTGPCTVQATVYTDFGRPTEKKQSLTLRLASATEVVDVGSVELGGKTRTVAEQK